MVPDAVCAELTTRFLRSPDLRTRRIPGEYLGTFHGDKTTDNYLDEAAAIRHSLDQLLDIPGSPLAVFREGLTAALAEDGVDFRLARHNGREACQAIFRSWRGTQGFALAPHEDIGQCSDPKQAGFEIQRAADHHIVGMNICLDNGPGGRVVLWNIQPDLASRRRLGLEHTGVPYPVECLDGVERITLDVHPGDIYLFNGAHVHAVESIVGASANRITLSVFLGFIDDKTVVSWT